MNSPSGDRMRRLQLALEAHAAWVEDGGPVRESPAAFLARHAELRDLLEPMLEEDEETAAESGATAAEPLRGELGPGATLGDFRIVRWIGSGGMGVVYEAVQLSLDRRVALKVLGGTGPVEPRALARFRREALAAAKLDHPAIVKVLAVGEQGSHAYFAMELVEGTTLQELAATKLEPKRAAEIGLQICSALEHAHAAQIVHRDVKPGNILIRQDGTAVLSDFGLARISDLPGLTRTGSQAGTAYYMAPEQIRGLVEGVRQTADVYALGVTLFEVLAGRRPFEGQTTPEVFRAILNDPPPDLEKLDPELPHDLCAIVGKAIEKDPSDRYPSAVEFGADLRAFLAFRPVTARPPSTSRRLARWARREPLKATLAVLATLLLIVSASLGIYVLSTQAERKLGEQRQREDTIELALAEAVMCFVVDRTSANVPAALDRVLALDPENGEALALAYLSREGARDTAGIEKLLTKYASAFERHASLRRLRDQVRWAQAEAAAGRTQATSRTSPPASPGAAAGAEELDMIALLLEGTRASNLAWATRSRHDARKAQSLLFRALLISPKPRLLLHWLYGDASSLAGDAEAARATSKAVLARWGSTPQTLFYAGSMLRHADPSAAAEIFRELLRLDPNHAAASRFLAYSLNLAGDVQGAMATLRPAAVQHPKDGGILSDLASFYFAVGKYKECVQNSERAIQLSPFLVEPHVNVASAYLKLGKLDKAEAHALKAIELGPEVVAARTSLGTVRNFQKRYAEAEATLRVALALNPDDVVALYNCGFALARLDRWKEAVELLDRALTLSPSVHQHVLVLAEEFASILEPPPQGVELFERARALQEAARRATTR